MKKCDDIRDLILTDYMDGQMAKDSAAVIESHLADCNHCRAFCKEVKEKAVLSLQQQETPSELWDKVRQAVEHKNQAFNPLEGILARISALTVFFPRLVPVLASLMVMMVAGSVSWNKIQIQQAREKDQGEYLISMVTPGATALTPENSDPGTPIETYFL
jgi:predicted anti-sigma-YlaC factor YlaD